MFPFSTLTEALQTQCTADRTITYIEGKDNESVVSYAELYERALKLLSGFQARGLQAGDECILFLRNNEAFIDAYWACVLGGIVPVPVAIGISDEHRAKLFKIYTKLNRPHLFTTEDNIERIEQYAQNHNILADYQALKKNTLLVTEFSDCEGEGVVHSADENDIAFIQFSSGSTSDPKGVMLTHKNILTNLNAIAVGGRYTDKDISFSWMPLTHDMGLIGFHLNMLVCRMSQCLMATDLFSRRPLLWLEKVTEKKATVLCSPNFGYKHFLKSFEKKGSDNIELSSVRLIYNGAEPISVELCDRFLSIMEPFGLRRDTMFTVYGLAEATLAVAFPVQGEIYRSVHVDRHALKTGETVKFIYQGNADAVSFAVVGKPVQDCHVRITDDDNRIFGDDIIGHIQISGDSVTQGYYQNEQANHAALVGEGWLDTGDLGFLHQGELIITGRAKDIIFANGLNYYPHDLEEMLLELDGIELGKVVVYGVWNDELQRDELLVFVLYRGELSDFVPLAKKVSRELNEKSGLDVDHVLPVNRIPKTTSGKIQRRMLADAYSNREYADIQAQLKQLEQSENNEKDASGDLSDLEVQLKCYCDEVTEGNKLSVTDNFFESGMSSLMLAEIHQKIDDHYPGKVDVVDLFEYQTIRELADFMQKKLQEE